MDISAPIDEVIAREGGYGHHPADRGGPTNFGITQAVARANGYAGDMRKLPRTLAETIYRRLIGNGRAMPLSRRSRRTSPPNCSTAR